MRFYTDPLSDPAGQAAILLRQFRNKDAAIKHAWWVVEKVVYKQGTLNFWLLVIAELKKL
jgi:hypothetical protein